MVASTKTRLDAGAHRERSTRQKHALETILADNSCFRSAQVLHAELCKRGESVGLTTVYNQLRQLASEGRVDVIRKPMGNVPYRRCGSEEHRHLHCRICGYAVEVAGKRIEELVARIAQNAGFSKIGGGTDIVGVCASCEPRVGAAKSTP